MTKPIKPLAWIMVPLTFVMSGCWPARETLRMTYDPTKVAPGVPRQDIERELGSPVSTEPRPGAGVEVVYRTGRSTPGTKNLLQSTAITYDVISLGTVEAMGAVSWSKSDLKSFKVIYGADGRAVTVEARCEAAMKTVIAVPPQGSPYLNCTGIDGKG